MNSGEEENRYFFLYIQLNEKLISFDDLVKSKKKKKEF